MRIVTGVVILLTLVAQPASSSEVFVTQVANRATATEQAAITSAKSELLALPVKLNAASLPIQAAVAAPGANTSVLLQTGTNNLAVASQAGGSNNSDILQHGNGNQAVLTQRNTH